MPKRHVLLRIFGFLRRSRNGIKSYIGEEHHSCTSQNARPSKVPSLAGVCGNKRMPVIWLPGMGHQECRRQRDEHAHGSYITITIAVVRFDDSFIPITRIV